MTKTAFYTFEVYARIVRLMTDYSAECYRTGGLMPAMRFIASDPDLVWC